MHTYRKSYHPYIGPFDPCRPIRVKYYETPPNLYLGYQPYGLQQFDPCTALKKGTLWPALYAPYSNPYKQREEDQEHDGTDA